MEIDTGNEMTRNWVRFGQIEGQIVGQERDPLCMCVCMRAKLLQLCLTLCNPLEPTSPLCPWDSPGKNTGVGCRALLQGIFPTHGSHLYLRCLLHWQADSSPSLPLHHMVYLFIFFDF